MNKTVKITILNETKTQITGLMDHDKAYFIGKYAKFAKNYFFNPKYRLKQWDGKINFFTRSGEFPTLLLEDIIPDIVSRGYQVELQDERIPIVKYPELIDRDIFKNIIHSKTGQPTQLRDYQVRCVNAIIESGYGIILASTGAGKTIITAALVTAFSGIDLRCLVIVPDETLARQTAEELIHYECDAGVYTGKVKKTDHKHIVATWQSLKNIPAYIKEFNFVIVDETHGAKGPILKSLLTEHGTNLQFRCGLTGTLPKDECEYMTVLSALGPIRETIPAHELISEGVLAQIDIDVLELVEDFKSDYDLFVKEELDGDYSFVPYGKFLEQYFPDYESEKKYLRKSPIRNEWIAELVETCRDNKNGNVLILVDNVDTTRTLGECISNAIVINGEDMKKATDRKKVYEMFNTHDDLVVVATSKICSTGIDIPRVNFVVMIDLGKSFIKVIQTIGRGLRKAHDKDSIKVIDISSNLKYAKKHAKDRLKFYKESKYPYKKHTIEYAKLIKVEK